MTHFAETVGWIVFLACVIIMSINLSKAVLEMVWDESAKGKVVDTTDALFAMSSTVFSWIKLMKSNWLATVCAVAVLLLMLGSTSISVYASFGYSVMAYAISGIFTPMLLRRLKPLSKASTLQASQPDKSIDS